jgi:23S rRNA pseudouridine2605 synthase
MLNKPMGVVTAVTPQHQETRQTVRDLIPIEGHLYPAGRLDADSEGLVLMTNDGDLAERLTHPRYQKAKVYEVTVLGRIPDEALEIWSRGVMLDDGMTLPVQIKVLRRDAQTSTLQITMTEGRKRQIRRVANTLGYPVQRLVRTHFATLSLGDLRPGEWRHLTESEVAALKALAYSLQMTPRRYVPRPPRKISAAARPAKPVTPSQGAKSRRTAEERPAVRTGQRKGRPAKPSAKRPTQRGKPSGTRRPPRRRPQT